MEAEVIYRSYTKYNKMPVIEVKLRKWGHSLGVIIPKEIIEREKVRENQTIRIMLMKDSAKVLQETFGMAKGLLKKPAQQIKDELRAELYDDG